MAFRWLHNGGPVNGDDTLSKKASAGVRVGAEVLWKVDHRERRSEMLIENIGARHIGNYTCIATNAAGKTSFTASLLVDGMYILAILAITICESTKRFSVPLLVPHC